MSEVRKSPGECFAALRQQLQQLQYFCKGTVLARMMKCGQPSCGCHTDTAKRHGPYWEWTYKAGGKTINVRLPAAVGPLYKAASLEHRRLKSLLRRMEASSRAALAALAKQTESAPTSLRQKRSPRAGTNPPGSNVD
jgi:hypothetical protein